MDDDVRIVLLLVWGGVGLSLAAALVALGCLRQARRFNDATMLHARLCAKVLTPEQRTVQDTVPRGDVAE